MHHTVAGADNQAPLHMQTGCFNMVVCATSSLLVCSSAEFSLAAIQELIDARCTEAPEHITRLVF